MADSTKPGTTDSATMPTQLRTFANDVINFCEQKHLDVGLEIAGLEIAKARLVNEWNGVRGVTTTDYAGTQSGGSRR